MSNSLDEHCRRVAGLKADLADGLAVQLGVRSARADDDAIRAAAYRVYGSFDTSGGYRYGQSLRKALNFVDGWAYLRALDAAVREESDGDR